MSLTVLEFVQFLAPQLVRPGKDIVCPNWPADVFAICCALLDRSGAVRGLGTSFLCEQTKHRHTRVASIQESARQWRIAAGKDQPFQAVENLWKRAIVESADSEVSELCRFRAPRVVCSPACEALLELCAIADEAFAGVGIDPDTVAIEDWGNANPDSLAIIDFWRITDRLLSDAESDQNDFSLGASLCRDLSKNRIRVLPKAQPPANGLSVRSLTTYIALCPPVDVPVRWYQQWRGNFATDRKCNMLLVPWPLTVTPSQFADCKVDPENPSDGWFSYAPDSDWHAPVNKVKELLLKAKREVGDVDVVILPETAVTVEQHEQLKNFLSAKEIKVPLIAGVYTAADNETGHKFGTNHASISFPSEDNWDPDTTFSQYKHHRWKLDGSQIETYGLATQLDPQKNWWEGIELRERSLNFFVCAQVVM